MTFCLGIKVREGLVGLADTRVTIGTEIITARKVYTHQRGRQSLFLMASGLRSFGWTSISVCATFMSPHSTTARPAAVNPAA